MKSKKNNYKKPAMQVVEIKHQGHLLNGTYDPQGDSGGGGAREQNSNWNSED